MTLHRVEARLVTYHTRDAKGTVYLPGSLSTALDRAVELRNLPVVAVHTANDQGNWARIGWVADWRDDDEGPRATFELDDGLLSGAAAMFVDRVRSGEWPEVSIRMRDCRTRPVTEDDRDRYCRGTYAMALREVVTTTGLAEVSVGPKGWACVPGAQILGPLHAAA